MRFDVVKRFHYYDEELTCRHFGLDYTFRLLPHVDFHVGDYRQEYAASIAAAGSVDLLFLDGAEDAHETLAQYEFFLPHMRGGSALLVHDWLTDKARLIRERLENSSEWRIENVLLPPRSVGCALAVRISFPPSPPPT
jgi:hypothetical protein